MSFPVFLAALPVQAAPGMRCELTGPEGRHAAVVRRIEVGETIVIADGAGAAVQGPVVETSKQGLAIRIEEVLEPASPGPRIVAVQALAKGDRSDLAVELMTEVGVAAILPWQAQRSIVRWSGERGDKARAKWQATAREATKQSRRWRVPEVESAVKLAGLVERVRQADRSFLLHEEATTWLPSLGASGEQLGGDAEVVVIIGPEGGITEEERAALVAAGAEPVLLNDGVLRTSTAGGIAVAHLRRP